jgi:hypothetical protein
MRRTLTALGLILLAAGAYAGNHTYTNIGDADECNGRSFRFNDHRAFVAEETIDAANVSALKVSADSSPVSVYGGNARGYSITVCKAAEFAEDLDDIHVTVSGGELRATGPSRHDWTVAYRILAPDRADLDVDSHNGPVSFSDVNGSIVAHLANGPVALHDIDGTVDVTTKNGPVSIEGGSGNIKLRATNGPLSVRLDGASFNGTLDASTQNGPLTVKVPRGYATGVVVEARGHGPISCRAEGCSGRAVGNDDDEDFDNDRPRRIELGRGPESVHITTVNGPVTIREE